MDEGESIRQTPTPLGIAEWSAPLSKRYKKGSGSTTHVAFRATWERERSKGWSSRSWNDKGEGDDNADDGNRTCLLLRNVTRNCGQLIIKPHSTDKSSAVARNQVYAYQVDTGQKIQHCHLKCRHRQRHIIRAEPNIGLPKC